MTTVTFEIDPVLEIETRDQTASVPVAELSPAIHKAIFKYGLSAFTDAANGAPRAAAVDALGKRKDNEKADAYDKRVKAWIAKDENEEAILAKTTELMEKRIAAALKGLWSTRGTGQSRREKILETIVLGAAKVNLSADDWAKFDAMSDEEQAAKVTIWYEGNKAKFDLAADERIAELDRKKEERKNLYKDVAPTMTL